MSDDKTPGDKKDLKVDNKANIQGAVVKSPENEEEDVRIEMVNLNDESDDDLHELRNNRTSSRNIGHHLREFMQRMREKRKNQKSLREQIAFAWGRIKAHVKLIGHMWPLIWPKGKWLLKIQVVISLLCLVLSKVISVLTPFAYKWVIDHLGQKDTGSLTVPYAAIILYGSGKVGTQLMGNLRDSIFTSVRVHAEKVAALQTFEHLHELSISYHLKRKTGGVLRAIDRGKSGISMVTRFMLFNTLPIIMEVSLTCIILVVSYVFYISLITFGCVIFYIIFTLTVTEWRTSFRRRMNAKDNEANNIAVDSLINFETVKYFTAEHHELKRYDGALKAYNRENEKAQWSLAFLNVGQSFVIAFGQFVVMLITAYQVTIGAMTVGDLVLVNTFLMQLYAPLNFLGSSYRMIKQALVDMETMFDLLDVGQDVEDVENPVPLDHVQGDIEFHNVRFTYGDEDEEVLKGVSFRVPAGKQMAIVGASGGGKSTILKLLFRFYEPTDGHITIDGVDISQVAQRDLRKQLGIVPQDTVLFNDTLKYNINYGDPSAEDDQVIEAARVAHILPLIERLNEGWETRVGERGLRLSGGEKQRVSIARAVLKGAPIIVYDEATSSLDTATEKEVSKALDETFKGRTTRVVLAHRLSTIIESDNILVMDKGLVAEQGSHDDLIVKPNGVYRKLWESQTNQSSSEMEEHVEEDDHEEGVVPLMPHHHHHHH